MPKKWDTKGQITYNNKLYDFLSIPLNDEVRTKFNEVFKRFKDEGRITLVSSAPFMNSTFIWIIENNKLYLKKALINYTKDKDEERTDKKRSIMPIERPVDVFNEIFPNQDKLFASWVNETVRIKLDSTIKDGMEIFDELHLEVVNGVIQNSKNVQQSYKTLRTYIEE